MWYITNFYAFKRLNNLVRIQKQIKAYAQERGLLGTILIAEEGINIMLAGQSEQVATDVTHYLIDSLELQASHIKRAQSLVQPFISLKVRIKPEIVTFRQPSADPTVCVGEYIAPKDWNAILNDPNIIVLDTRNGFEYLCGHFKGAVNPKTKTFSEFATYIQTHLDPTTHSKVAMYCTGGIRCEKASSYLLQLGFEHVYHLEGGILKYFEEVPVSESLWVGECFVFDERISVGHR